MGRNNAPWRLGDVLTWLDSPFPSEHTDCPRVVGILRSALVCSSRRVVEDGLPECGPQQVERRVLQCGFTLPYGAAGFVHLQVVQLVQSLQKNGLGSAFQQPPQAAALLQLVRLIGGGV